MKGKNVDFNAGKSKNNMNHQRFEPGTFDIRVRCPYPYITDSLANLAEKIKHVIIQWQKSANI